MQNNHIVPIVALNPISFKLALSDNKKTPITTPYSPNNDYKCIEYIKASIKD